MAPTKRASGSAGGTRERQESEETKGARARAEEEEEAEERSDEPEIQTLVVLAQMDAEAATAYEIAADMIDIPDVKNTILGFAADHRRHIQSLERVLAGMGFSGVVAAPDPQSSTFAAFSLVLGPLGPQAALMALLASEQFTNSAYDTAFELVSDEEAEAVILRNLEDERRHLTWLVENKDRVGEAAEEEGSDLEAARH